MAPCRAAEEAAMIAVLERLVADAHKELTPDLAEAFESMLRSFVNHDDADVAVEFEDSFEWIAKQKQPVMEKAIAVRKLIAADRAAPAGTPIGLKRLLGW